MLAPIALYPDDLLAQVLAASTYAIEVVQAARFAKENASLKGDALTQAAKDKDWDPSVKAMLAFPDVLQMMNDKLDWTQNLGDAFLGQQREVMESVQRLRAKAQDSGNLKTTKEQVVKEDPGTQVIVIQPSSPEVVYVPAYDPGVVYGTWPYPAYPPYPYYPPTYVPGAAAFGFVAGVAIGAAFGGWGAWGCNWGGGCVNVNVNNYNNFTNKNYNNNKYQKNGGGNQNWNRDSSKRSQSGGNRSQGSGGNRGGDRGYGGDRGGAGSNRGGAGNMDRGGAGSNKAGAGNMDRGGAGSNKAGARTHGSRGWKQEPGHLLRRGRQGQRGPFRERPGILQPERRIQQLRPVVVGRGAFLRWLQRWQPKRRRGFAQRWRRTQRRWRWRTQAIANAEPDGRQRESKPPSPVGRKER